MLVSDARIIWNTLKGVICIYKPAEVSCNQIRKTITTKLAKELCELNCRPPIQYVSIEGDPTKSLSVKVQDSFADNPLVIGPRYLPTEIRCTWSTFLGKQTSGVLILGINGGTKKVEALRQAKPLRVYRITGKFGEATDNYYKDGHIVEKSTYKYIRRYNIERLLSAMQAIHQRKMFELCGVDMKSQAAYELAVQGLIRPSNSEIPLIYGIKCVDFKGPEFAIEIQCVNEYEMYLKTIIHEIGMQLHSTAHCTSIKCIRHSYFTLDHALLGKHWTLQNIVDNMKCCETILNEHNDIFTKQSVTLQS